VVYVPIARDHRKEAARQAEAAELAEQPQAAAWSPAPSLAHLDA